MTRWFNTGHNFIMIIIWNLWCPGDLLLPKKTYCWSKNCIKNAFRAVNLHRALCHVENQACDEDFGRSQWEGEMNALRHSYSTWWGCLLLTHTSLREWVELLNICIYGSDMYPHKIVILIPRASNIQASDWQVRSTTNPWQHSSCVRKTVLNCDITFNYCFFFTTLHISPFHIFIFIFFCIIWSILTLSIALPFP